MTAICVYASGNPTLKHNITVKHKALQSKWYGQWKDLLNVCSLALRMTRPDLNKKESSSWKWDIKNATQKGQVLNKSITTNHLLLKVSNLKLCWLFEWLHACKVAKVNCSFLATCGNGKTSNHNTDKLWYKVEHIFLPSTYSRTNKVVGCKTKTMCSKKL